MLLSVTEGAIDKATLTTILGVLLELPEIILGFIASNPILFASFATSFVGLACIVLKKVKRISKV